MNAFFSKKVWLFISCHMKNSNDCITVVFDVNNWRLLLKNGAKFLVDSIPWIHWVKFNFMFFFFRHVDKLNGFPKLAQNCELIIWFGSLSVNSPFVFLSKYIGHTNFIIFTHLWACFYASLFIWNSIWVREFIVPFQVIYFFIKNCWIRKEQGTKEMYRKSSYYE